MLVIMFIVYCIFAMATNIVASSTYHTSDKMDPTLISNYGILAISLGSKQLNATQENITLYSIQAWFGVGMLLLWIGYLVFIKGKEKRAEYRVRNESYSASDFSIMMENVPRHITPDQIQRELTKYSH